jgi:hypothetical protein
VTEFIFISVSALALVVVFLSLVLAGVVRSLGHLREDMEAGRMRNALPRAGDPVPVFSATTDRDDRFVSTDVAGEEVLTLFVHPGCAPCEELVPLVIRLSLEREMPRVLLVTVQGSSAWREQAGEGSRITIIREEHEAVSSLFGVSLRPFAVLIDKSHRLAARGAVSTLSDVYRLMATMPDRQEQPEYRSLSKEVMAK